MRRVLQSLLFTVLLVGSGLFFGAVLTSQSGCTRTQQRTAVNTLSSVGQATDAAIKAYLDQVVAGQVKTNDVPSVMARYSEFQAAYNLALIAATLNTNAPPTPEVTANSANVKSAIAVAKTR